MRAVIFLLKGGLKQWSEAVKRWPPDDTDYAYMDVNKPQIFGLERPVQDYDEFIIVDSTASSGITMLMAEAFLREMGARGEIKLAAFPNTKIAREIIDIHLPKQGMTGKTIFFAGYPGIGKSGIAAGVAHALGLPFVRWGKEVVKRFDIGKYGEKLRREEEKNPFIISEKLLLDGVFDTQKDIVVDGVKDVWQVIHVSYALRKPAILFFIDADEEARDLILDIRSMPDDTYRDDRDEMFREGLERLKSRSLVIKVDKKKLEGKMGKYFEILGIDPTIKGYFNPFITKEVLLINWFKAWTKAGNLYSKKIDEWIDNLNIRMHRGYVERLKRKGIDVDEKRGEMIALIATAVRIIDDILDEHTIRYHSETGEVEEAYWVRRGIFLSVIDSVVLMVKARRIARELGVEDGMIEAVKGMVDGVMRELELERSGRKPTIEDWLVAVKRETEFRRFVYELFGMDGEEGALKGLISQMKDDLYGGRKGGREDTDRRLNRPLIQDVIPNPDVVIKELRNASGLDEAIRTIKRSVNKKKKRIIV